MSTEWVNVKDRLPKPDASHRLLVHVVRRSGTGKISTDAYGLAGWLWYGDEEAPRVTHWRHLPSPPDMTEEELSAAASTVSAPYVPEDDEELEAAVKAALARHTAYYLDE